MVSETATRSAKLIYRKKAKLTTCSLLSGIANV